MISREEVKATLPYLRRLARVAIGSTKLGDEAVARALGAVATVEAKPGWSVRTTLYHGLCRELIESPSIDPVRSVRRDDDVLTDRMATLDPVDRLLMLLVSLEQFPSRMAAQILDLDPDNVDQRLELARERLHAQEPANILIIEDEPMIALDLASIVESHGHRVLNIARTRAEARAKSRTERPDLMLADIRLADESSGIDAVADITRDNGDIPVVFITAFPERLLQGIKGEPAFMLTKPFDEQMVAIAIAQVQQLSGRRSGSPETAA